MDERKIKRLLITLAMAIVVIMVAKFLMIKVATSLGNAAHEKKRSAAGVQPPAPINETTPSGGPETSTASVVEDATVAASSVEGTGR